MTTIQFNRSHGNLVRKRERECVSLFPFFCVYSLVLCCVVAFSCDKRLQDVTSNCLPGATGLVRSHYTPLSLLHPEVACDLKKRGNLPLESD